MDRDRRQRGTGPTLLCGLALLAMGCGVNLDKVPDAEVDPAQKAKAQQVGTKVQQACVDGTFDYLTDDEATPSLKEGLSPEKQKSACESIKKAVGDFQSLEYVETWKPKDGAALRIYRFKTKFSKVGEPWETRVTLDGTAKCAGIWTKPWSDTPR